MRSITSLFIMLFSLVFLSCEGFVDYKGTIYDAKTKMSLDSVKCVMIQFEDLITYSDSLGNYWIRSDMVGCVPDCNDYTVEFSKKGYKTLRKQAPTDIYLERE